MAWGEKKKEKRLILEEGTVVVLLVVHLQDFTDQSWFQGVGRVGQLGELEFGNLRFHL